MSTNIQSLPLYQASLGVALDEDLEFSLAFYASDGVTALSLAGIGFSCAIGALASLTVGNGITITGTGSNILTVFVAAAAKASWAPGVYALALTASDGIYTKDVFARSTASVFNSGSNPISLAQIKAGATALVAGISNQTAANTAAIAALQAEIGNAPPTLVSSSAAISAAGVYIVTTSNLTLTLPSPSTWSGGPIVIKDGTLSANPNIAIIGTVDQDAGGAIINAPNESLSLSASAALNSWIVL